MSKDMDVGKNNNIKYSYEMSLSNSCLTIENDDDVQNDVRIIENQMHDNDSDNDSDNDDDDYMAEFDYGAYLNLKYMDKYEMYDIAIENLTP